jgi:site-specific DNA-cytosine methylase
MEDLRRASARRRFDIVSLFANIEGFGMGAMRAGVVLANEIAPVAIRIHRLNFPETVLDRPPARAASVSLQNDRTAARACRPSAAPAGEVHRSL